MTQATTVSAQQRRLVFLFEGVMLATLSLAHDVASDGEKQTTADCCDVNIYTALLLFILWLPD